MPKLNLDDVPTPQVFAGGIFAKNSSQKRLDAFADAGSLQSFQAAAATLSEDRIPPDGATVISSLVVANGDVASATESLVIDVLRVRAGSAVSMLTATDTIDDTVAADSVRAVTTLDSSVTLAAGDTVRISRTYTAGTPTPITNTTVKVSFV